MEAQARAALDGVNLNARVIRSSAERFAACPSDSIDYAVTERAERMVIVPVSCGWSDVGSWDALTEIGNPETRGNMVPGDAVLIDVRNTPVPTDGLTVTASGIQDLIIIADGSHVMIVPKSRSQDVKKIVEALKARTPH